jgi:beta-glucosidase
MREVYPKNKYGIVLNLVPIEPDDAGSAQAVSNARRRWLSNYAVYLEALLKGRYPDVVLAEMAANGIEPVPGDMSLIAQSLDYLGVNWYLRFVVDKNDNIVPVPGAELTQMGWEMHPAALTRMLVSMSKEYHLPPIYITENGAALDDKVEEGRIHDRRRTQYLYEHIQALEAASVQGVNIRGYFAWSLMDNLEWSLGYKMTFGIVHVDRHTLLRTVKDSGRFYGKLIALHHKKRKKSERCGKGHKGSKRAKQ